MIKDEVNSGHLARFPEEREIISRFTPDFDITWASRFNRFNTDTSIYFLKPQPHITQSFGFEQELLLAISPYNSLQARFIQVVEQIFQQLPARGRVDQTAALIVSHASNVDEWLQNYAAENPQMRAYVGLSAKSLIDSKEDWFLRNKLADQLFSRDLFDYTLPLDNDLFFFGRQAIVAEHIDAIRRSENRGLFGLRKTGKTSVLFKIRRQCEENGIVAIYYDCKLPSIYKLTSDDLLRKVCSDINEKLWEKTPRIKKSLDPTTLFLALADSIPAHLRICLIFDEVEYISPLSKLAPLWSQEFIPFWQTIWSAQSQFRKFSFIVAGVNAALVETDKFSGVQNPMFSIVRSKYLTGFERSDLSSLATVFGKRMGLHFDQEALDCLHLRYGGHPLLTRMICSQINASIKAGRKQRPVKIGMQDVTEDLKSREEEVSFYCGHITSELEEFYPIEFEMLELLAIGNISDFNEFAEDIDLVRHLKSYGLVDLSKPFQPKFKIPVIEGYVAAKWKRKGNKASNKYVVPVHRREAFVVGRSSSILRDFRMAEKKFSGLSLPAIYNGSGPFEAELFAKSTEVTSQAGLVSFLNQAYRSLIEPIDKVGKQKKLQGYFHNDIKKAYPKLWGSLNRVRSYRHFYAHIELRTEVQVHVDDYLLTDLDGQDPANIVDGWFRLQAAVLNELLIGLQAELATYD